MFPWTTAGETALTILHLPPSFAVTAARLCQTTPQRERRNPPSIQVVQPLASGHNRHRATEQPNQSARNCTHHPFSGRNRQNNQPTNQLTKR